MYTDLKDIKNVCNNKLYESTSVTAFFFFTPLSLSLQDIKHQLLLDSTIFVDELIKAVGSFSQNKSPGLDGFGSKFYQAFCESLTPILLRMINDSFF